MAKTKKDIVISTSEVILKERRKKFYDHFTLNLGYGVYHRIHVGDTVALACEESLKERNETWAKWKDQPWSAAQILSIREETGEYKVEVRWFWRICEMKKFEPQALKKLKGLPKKKSCSLNYLIETDHTNTADAETILGRVFLTSKKIPEKSFERFAKEKWSSDRQVARLCTSFAKFQGGTFSQVTDWGVDNGEGIPSPCVLRGMGMQQDDRLVESYLTAFAQREPFDWRAFAESRRASRSKKPSSSGPSSTPPSRKRKALVAHDTNAPANSNKKQKAAGKVTAGKTSGKATKQPKATKQLKSSSSVVSVSSTSTSSRKKSSASIVSISSASTSSRKGKTMSKAKPTRQITKRKSVRSVKSLASEEILNRSKESKKNQTSRSSRTASPAPSVASTVASLINADSRVSVSVPALHFDKSMFRAYYTEMMIKPPLSHSAVHSAVHEENEGHSWRVQVGDIVSLHCEHGAGKTAFGMNHSNVSSHFPFKVGWGVAEIVAIWKQYDDESEFSTAMRKKSKLCVGDLELEIRWFWRKCEVERRESGTANDLCECEEVFETDNVDRCTATSLLAPVKLVPTTYLLPKESYYLGLPVVQFKCTRFWSFHRKSIVPFASVAGREARYRFYSRCLTKDTVLRDKLEHFQQQSDSPEQRKCHEEKQQPSVWKESFQNVISKLSLTQASEDAFGRGGGLIGRKEEQGEITSFLRAAIQGAHDGANTSSSDGTRHPSMFVAGPPGTGKSVSVCSIIAKLRQDQTRGKLPDFDFFALNGMEMRHPYDAYVQFWEAISGDHKERVSPELAASKLERYFSAMPVKGAPKRSVIVLMLDEIDYLVTKKQTVLYNFFDWPKRSFQMPDCPRLIVVGISNTVNLPSSLKPSVRSRLGGCRCDFKSYNFEDIVKILTSKIQPKKSDYNVFDKDAIKFAAKKIAAVTGDIRKALQTCKTAAEKVMQEVENGTRDDPKSQANRPVVRIRDIQKVAKEKIGVVMSNAIAAAAPLEALVLVSLSALTKHSGRQTGGFDMEELMKKAASVANASGNMEYSPAPTFNEMLDILNRLAEARLVRLHTEKSSSYTFRASQGGSGGAWPAIALNLDDSDIISSLRQGSHAQLAIKHLDSGFSLGI